ncbi:outer membrane protein OmpA-like peptidoglycan-associated protein [Yoonia maricola]|uniref:Outer membrane protein OmpA-like peptidoglycan-associated protein n=1 Tax=Yoonia maricola TaxID=420999 RepID=A0A2M8W2S4_9RHOB|nr:OmpA family protein [Yoonia maricola]PJI85232.1 outer membrane protein OmpA-like peptidoglycan-associated protein [Yoonia maricola]
MTFTKFPLVLAAASLTFVAACDPTGPNQYENTQQGALIGAGAGAVLGAITNNDGSVRERNQAALIGAALGAGVGAGVGNSLDRQAEELRRQLRNDVGVSNNGNNLVVVLSEDLLFATNSTQLSGTAQNELRIVASSLQQYPDTTVNVIGHTDNVGEASYNQGLSEQRASAVSSILIGGGVSATRIRSIGAGENNPIASNLNAAGRQANRRVEIVITPN